MSGLVTGEALAAAFRIALGGGAGVLLGLGYFAALHWNTGLYLGRSLALGLGVQLLRFAVLGAAFFGLALLGAGALLSGAVGLLVARRIVLNHAGRLP